MLILQNGFDYLKMAYNVGKTDKLNCKISELDLIFTFEITNANSRITLRRKKSLHGIYYKRAKYEFIQARNFKFNKTIKFNINDYCNSYSNHINDTILITIDETKDGLYYIIKDSNDSFWGEGYFMNALELNLLKKNFKKIRKEIKEIICEPLVLKP